LAARLLRETPVRSPVVMSFCPLFSRPCLVI
jgi:hypothetical protein